MIFGLVYYDADFGGAEEVFVGVYANFKLVEDADDGFGGFLSGGGFLEGFGFFEDLF